MRACSVYHQMYLAVGAGEMEQLVYCVKIRAGLARHAPERGQSQSPSLSASQAALQPSCP